MSNVKEAFFSFPFLKYFHSIFFSDNSETNESIMVLFYFPATALFCLLIVSATQFCIIKAEVLYCLSVP